MVDVRQNIAGEHVALLHVRISRQDERLDTLGLVGAQFGEHLVGGADDRGPAARSGAADAGPQVLFHEAVAVRRPAQFGLSLDTVVLSVERGFADRAALLVVELGQQAVLRGNTVIVWPCRRTMPAWEKAMPNRIAASLTRNFVSKLSLPSTMK